VQLSLLGHARDAFAQDALGIGVALRTVEKLREVEASRREVRIEHERLAILLLGVLHVALVRVHDGEVEVRAGSLQRRALCFDVVLARGRVRCALRRIERVRRHRRQDARRLDPHRANRVVQERRGKPQPLVGQRPLQARGRRRAHGGVLSCAPAMLAGTLGAP
jgi:hypothetical protein